MTETRTEKLVRASERGDVETVSNELAAGGDPNTRADSGLPLLLIAAGRGHADLVDHLVVRGADVTLLEPKTGASALHLAAQRGHVETAARLLAHGAQVNLQAASHGMTPLMNAVWYRNPEMVSFLLERERINTKLQSTFGSTARDLASPETVAPDPGGEGRADPPDATRIRRLFDEYESTAGETSEGEELFAAVVNEASLDRQEQLATVRSLIEAGADVNYVSPVNGSGNDGHTPLLVAARDGLPSIVEELLIAGADVRIVDEYMRATPVHKAAYMGHAAVLRVLAEQPEFDEIVDAQGPYNGYTALHDAAWHGHATSATVLVEAGANVDVRAHDGDTPYDLATKYGYGAITALLRDQSADVEQET